VCDRDWQAEIRLLQKREQRAREILGVPDSAGKEDIKRAWRRESLKHHPDHNGGSTVSHREFILLNCAYRFLTEGLGCDELDSDKPPAPILADTRCRSDAPSDYLVWWRKKYFQPEENGSDS
jgi:hypothetical protein